jgi:hypothetical protein
MFTACFLLGTVTLVFNSIRPFGPSIGISDLLYFVALAALVIESLLKRKPLQKWMPWHPLWVSATLILLGGLLSSTQSDNLAGSIVATLKSTFVFSIWLSMGFVMVYQRRQASKVIGALIVGALISSMIAIYDKLAGADLGPAVFGLTNVTLPGVNLEVMADVYGRYGGSLGHPNVQSEFTLVVIPIVLDMSLSAWQTSKRFKSLALLITLALLVWANLLTGSFSGLIGVLLAFVLVLGLRLLNQLSRLFVPSCLFAASASTILLIYILLIVNSTADPFQRLVDRLVMNENVNRALITTGPERLELVGETLKLIAQNPITGLGMNLLEGGPQNTSSVASSGDVHNAILRSWVVGGIFVFLGVAYAYFWCLRLVIRTIRKYLRGNRVHFIIGLAASIIVWTINDLVQPSFQQRFTWLTFIILYGIYRYSFQSARMRRTNEQADVGEFVQERHSELPLIT